MQHRRALLGPLALQALRALLAVLLAGGVSVVAASCKVNQVETWVYNKFLKFNEQKCTPCGVGQYGSDGKCYDCPSFTRRRKDRDPNTFSGTLWCSNSCADIYANRDNVKDVQIYTTIRSSLQAQKAVLQYEVIDVPYDGVGNADSRTTRNAVCKPCDAGKFLSQYKAQEVLTYHKHDLAVMLYSQAQIDELVSIQGRLERFTWSLCRACPTGLVPGGWVVPDDVREMTGDGALKPVNTDLVIPCKACGVRQGVPQPVADSKTGAVTCQPCLNRMYQIRKTETFIVHVELKKPNFADELMTLVVGASCAHCPAGQQALAAYGADPLHGAFWVGPQCRGSAEECCSPCPLNQFKEKAEGVCKNADPGRVVLEGDKFTLSGGLRQRECGGGERLTYCTVDGCGKTSGWRTCLPCSLDETTFEREGGGCAACEPANHQHLVDKSNPNQCAECDLCSELAEQPSTVLLNTLSNFEEVPSEYTVARVTASCVPLQRRRLEKSASALGLAGDAHWRQRNKAQGEPLPPHHFLDRTNGCNKAPCAGRCKTPFMYSDGCGNSVEPAKTWVQAPGQAPAQSPQRLAAVSLTAVANASAWTVLSEGNCQFCTPCVAGEFNEGCDKKAQYVLGAPEGSCKPCLQSCNPGLFLLHREKEAGCHEPPTHLNATDNSSRFATLEDYTCARCPTWVKQGQNLSIVAACGLQTAGATYEHFIAVPVNGVLQKTAKAVEPLTRGEELLAGVPRKNFRGFMNSLKNYCVEGYFFDPQIPGCGFVNSGSPLAVSARKTVIVGFDAYRPACCQACKNCAGAIARKDMSSWRQCTGNSVEDVQDRCVAKCVLGYWEQTVGTNSTAEKRCNRCSSCFDGVV